LSGGKPQLKKSAGRALERGWIAEMLAGTRLGVAGPNIGNLAASHLPFASYSQPCASYRLFYMQPSPSQNWRMPAKLRLVASAPPADASHRSQRMSSLFPARSQRVRTVALQRSASRIFLLGNPIGQTTSRHCYTFE